MFYTADIFSVDFGDGNGFVGLTLSEEGVNIKIAQVLAEQRDASHPAPIDRTVVGLSSEFKAVLAMETGFLDEILQAEVDSPITKNQSIYTLPDVRFAVRTRGDDKYMHIYGEKYDLIIDIELSMKIGSVTYVPMLFKSKDDSVLKWVPDLYTLIFTKISAAQYSGSTALPILSFWDGNDSNTDYLYFYGSGQRQLAELMLYSERGRLASGDNTFLSSANCLVFHDTGVTFVPAADVYDSSLGGETYVYCAIENASIPNAPQCFADTVVAEIKTLLTYAGFNIGAGEFS
jgi:hypothetical protein